PADFAGGHNSGAAPKTERRSLEQSRLRRWLVNRKALDGFLEFLGGAEGDLLARLDLDGFAGRRVAAHARSALADLQNAQAREADTIALLEMVGHHVNHAVEQGLGLLLGNLMLLGELRCQMLQRNRGGGGFVS